MNNILQTYHKEIDELDRIENRIIRTCSIIYKDVSNIMTLVKTNVKQTTLDYINSEIETLNIKLLEHRQMQDEPADEVGYRKALSEHKEYLLEQKSEILKLN